jgi:phage gp29-like protein
MADTPQLVHPTTGQPLSSQNQALTVEIARAALTSVRQAWNPETAVAGLSPDRLDAILRRANIGDLRAYLTLAEEMEERDPHYGSVLQTRKLAVMGLESQLTWSAGQEADPRAAEILEACQTLVARPAFEDLQFGLLDAIAKGYSAVEMIWRTDLPRWEPRAYKWRDPRWFKWDRETGEELHLVQMGAVDGVPLPPNKFAIWVATRKSGLPARAGLARLVAFSFVCKLYGLKDWMSYAEIFGIPVRLGRYDGTASAADVDTLKRAVFNMGADAAAVLPKSMDIEFPDLGKATGGAELFHLLVTYLDQQISKAVLGQTGTTDMQKGGGLAQAKVLDEVRADLTKADARGIGAAITESVLTPYVAFNWGPDAPVPSFQPIVQENEDVTALSNALAQLVPLGLRVDQAEIRKKFKLSEPASDAELLSPPARIDFQGQIPGDGPPGPTPALARHQLRAALAAAMGQPAGQARIDQDLTDAQLAELDGWKRNFGPEAQAVIDVVRDAQNFEQIRVGLDGLARDLSAPATARSLARAMFSATVIGDARRRPRGR